MSSSNSTVEVIEKNKIKLTINLSPEKFKEGIQHAYNRNKASIAIQGFRKGKAPRKIIEQMYGKDIFYEEAINFLLPEVYEEALKENDIEPVYRPTIDVDTMDEATGAVVTAEVYTKPEVEVDGYTGLTYPIADPEPTEEEISNRLQSEREKNSRTVTVDRPAELGDMVNINFTGYIDDVAFEGGKAEDYELTLGTKSFIDNFEDQLVGHAAGDDVTVNVTFPEDYGREEFNGKPARFEVEILEVQAKELPQLDDEFAQDVSEFETLQEFRDDITNKLREEKEQRVLMEKRRHLVQQLVEKTEMDVPEAMYTAKIEEMTEDMRYKLWQQGLQLEQYLAFSQMTMQSLQDSYKTPAKEDVDARLVLTAIAKKEGFEASDEDIRAHIEKIAQPHENVDDIITEINDVEEDYRKKAVIADILNQKALDFVVEKAVAMETIE